MRKLTGLILLQPLLWLCLCTPDKEASSQQTEVEVAMEKQDLTEEAYAWADSVARSMPLESQAAQLLMPAVYARSDTRSMAKLREYADMHIGGLVLLRGDVSAITAIADTLHAIELADSAFQSMFLAIDAETGLNMRLKDAPSFPWNSRVDERVDDQTFFDYGAEIGREADLIGINMILGPVVDIVRLIEGKGIMKLRSLGYDKERVAALGAAYSKGVESKGVISVAKHFPGHGPTSVDTHKGLARISKERTELESVDLFPFKTLTDNATSGVMVGHIWAPALDSVKRPASFSPVVINEILKGELDFKGLVIVDALGMGGAKGFTSADAIASGADIILAPVNTLQEINNIIEAVEAGKLSREDVLDRCRRVLFYKYLFNIPGKQRPSYGMSYEELIDELFLQAEPIRRDLSR